MITASVKKELIGLSVEFRRSSEFEIIVVRKNTAKFQGKHSLRTIFFNKVEICAPTNALKSNQSAMFSKAYYKVFPRNVLKCLSR